MVELDELKKGVYSTINDIANQVKTRTGPFGDFVKKLEEIASDTKEGAAEFGRDVREMGELTYNNAKKASRKASLRGMAAYQCLAKKVNTAYKNLNESFFTDGKFDYDKAKEALKDNAETIKVHGRKAYDSLVQMIADGKDAVVADFRSYVPSEEELKTRYDGIGTDYNGVLLREHYDSCVDFFDSAINKIPKGVKYRAQILEDIRASASGSLKDLRTYYAEHIINDGDKAKSVPDKLKIIDRYFS